jgi:hypothetical protein
MRQEIRDREFVPLLPEVRRFGYRGARGCNGAPRAGIEGGMTLINGWRIDADYLIGRRFEFTNGFAPDVTFVSARSLDGAMRAHCKDGGKWWIPLDLVCVNIKAGVLVESEAGVPFTLTRDQVTNGRIAAEVVPIQWYHNVKGWGA